MVYECVYSGIFYGIFQTMQMQRNEIELNLEKNAYLASFRKSKFNDNLFLNLLNFFFIWFEKKNKEIFYWNVDFGQIWPFQCEKYMHSFFICVTLYLFIYNFYCHTSLFEIQVDFRSCVS